MTETQPLIRSLFSLLTLFVAAPLFANVTTTIHASENGRVDVRRVPMHAAVEYEVHVSSQEMTTVALEIDPPANVVELQEFSETVECGAATERPIRCTIQTTGFRSEAVRIVASFDTPGTKTLTARVNNVPYSYTLDVSSEPSISLNTSTTNIPYRRAEPGQVIEYATTLFGGGATAQNVVVTWTLPNGGTLEEITGLTDCTIEATRATCRRPTLADQEYVSIELKVRAPSRRDGGAIVLQSAVTADGTDFDPSDNAANVSTLLQRHMVVTNTNDAGAGSLRQALLEAQTLCANEPCTVVFNIPAPVPAGGRFTIRPQSELPEVRGWVAIKGATQRDFTGDTSDGPEIAIAGDQAGDANGLVLGRGCEVQVLDLAISGFTRSGIEALRGQYDAACDRNMLEAFPNTRIWRNRLEANHRGVMLVDTGFSSVNQNVIVRNRRAGIYATRGFYAEISGNQIAGNGASGMYLDVGTRDPYPGGADVQDNAIVDNGEWGIARTNRGEISMRRNAIALNRYLGIDLNLDFETPNRPVDDVTGVPNKPVLFSAQYDPARGVTVVRGRLETQNTPIARPATVDVYVSTNLSDVGQAAAEHWVAEKAFPGGPIAADFEIEFAGDVRGKFITATTTRERIVGLAKPPEVSSDSHIFAVPSDTSELSNVVTVQ